jgi:hypothetical protein
MSDIKLIVSHIISTCSLSIDIIIDLSKNTVKLNVYTLLYFHFEMQLFQRHPFPFQAQLNQQ